MKYSLTLALILTTFTTASMAETTPSNPKQPPAAVQNPVAQVPNSEMPKPDMYKNINGITMDKRISKRSDNTWKELDTNDDGFISEKESIAFSKRKFEEKDTNNDDKVTRAEWDAFREKKINEIRNQYKARKAIDDKNPSTTKEIKK